MPRKSPWRLAPIALALWSGLIPSVGSAADEQVVQLKAIAGLRYDQARFAVPPNTKVRLVLTNADDMAHNFLITAPGARMEIVQAAMAMPFSNEQTFIPKSDKVLWSIPVLTPGKSATINFTTPAKEGVYPYVCTYPGHGMIMYGAMYVTTQPLPPLATDENAPEMLRQAPEKLPLHSFTPQPPYHYRIFMRDSGPASIAVALPQDQNYCWDAGTCRLRYAWHGGFVDPRAHWAGNGDAFAEVKGRIYYRTPNRFPLEFGSGKAPAKIQFKGYRLVERYPEFRYEVDGVEVRELIKPLHHGGLEQTFMISGAKTPVRYVSDPAVGAKLSSSVGQFKNGVLELSAEQARQFTLTVMELPNQEAVGYWSMDDVLSEKRPLPVAGMRNRALVFDGKKSQYATGLGTQELTSGATFLLWAKLKDPGAPEQVFLGGKDFAIGSNIGGIGLGVSSLESKAAAGEPADKEWHHVAVKFTAEGLTLYVDGQKRGQVAGAKLPERTALFLGSRGGSTYGAATLDEVRVYARALSDAEIAAQIKADRAASNVPPAL